jgi:hypothetical protein
MAAKLRVVVVEMLETVVIANVTATVIAANVATFATVARRVIHVGKTTKPRHWEPTVTKLHLLIGPQRAG